MKWYESGIMFEGTPEEFRTLHPEIAGSAPASAISIFPDKLTEDAEKPRQRAGKRPRWHVVAELAGGGERHFKSGASAWRWYAAACPVRKITNKIAFYNALRAGSVRFADAEIKLRGEI